MNQVAAIQLASGPNKSANLLEVERLIGQAADAGAELVVLPENFSLMGRPDKEILAACEEYGSGPLQSFLAEQAVRRGVWLVGGTIPLKGSSETHYRTSSLLLNSSGEVVSRYDKIHLFDVHIAESGEDYNESATIEPGTQVVVTDSPFGRIGIAICYDLRFPGLFRRMVDEGVELVVLPAAFTAITGRAHWEVLLRARAIENQVYMVAAAQGGFHLHGRETYGHSMVVDPWGTVIGVLPSGSGVVMAKLDRKRQQEIRNNFPVLKHRRISCHLP